MGDVDLTDKFEPPLGRVFAPLRDVEHVAQVSVDTEIGTVVWPKGADLVPDVLHQQALGFA